MKDWILTKDNVFSEQECDELINLYKPLAKFDELCYALEKLVKNNISTSLNSNLMLATPEKMKKLKDYYQIFSCFFFSLLGYQIKLELITNSIENIVFYRSLFGTLLLLLFFSELLISAILFPSNSCQRCMRKTLLEGE